MAVSGVNEGPNFELFESDAKNPIAWGTTEGPEAIPTRHRLSYVLWRHFRAGDIFVDVDRLVAVVSLRFRCETNDARLSLCAQTIKSRLASTTIS